ncbi:MAG: SDR family oxidoreductase [Eubacteriales bacterium]|nr:SDR family oxidoreductase [Eubacteriales bacterium]
MKHDLETMYSVKGKVIVISGGSGGIGSGFARALLDLGATVVLLDHNEESLRRVSGELAACGAPVDTQTANITDYSSVEESFAQIYHRHGRIDGLVNCAGINIVKSLADLSADEYEQIIQVNLLGTVFCSKAASKYMLNAHKGRIVNISSLAATHGKPNYTAYTASKAAVNGFTFTLATELARKGITVNAISPVLIVTDINRNQIQNDPAYFENVVNMIPAGRVSEVEDIVGLLVFLLSDSSAFLTGQNIGCDGGAQNGDVGVIKPESYSA